MSDVVITQKRRAAAGTSTSAGTVRYPNELFARSFVVLNVGIFPRYADRRKFVYPHNHEKFETFFEEHL